MTQRISNAREKDQKDRMEELARRGLCFFCDKNYLKVFASAAIYETEHWYIKKNDYPYNGSTGHYMIVSTYHATRISELPATAWIELPDMYAWIEKNLAPAGYSSFVRMGDTTYTGATFEHLHFQVIWGISKPEDWKCFEDNILVTLGYKKK